MRSGRCCRKPCPSCSVRQKRATVLRSGPVATRPAVVNDLGASRPLLSAFRAQRARNAERVSKTSPGASGPGTPKSLQKVSGTVREASGELPEKVSGECFWSVPGLLGVSKNVSGASARETFFRDSFGLSGPLATSGSVINDLELPSPPPHPYLEAAKRTNYSEDRGLKVRFSPCDDSI